MPANGQDVKFNYYTRAKFNALSSKDNNAIYYVEETNNTISMYIGNRKIATGTGIDLHRVRIFNEQDELITTQIIHEGDKVLPLDKPGHLFEYGTRNEFDYDTIITEDIDLIYSIIPPRYVQTTVEDFTAGTFGDYIGTEEYIILPADKPSGYRIQNINVKGVATNGDYLTSAFSMFRANNSLYLELDYLDTNNVTNMQYMFQGNQATTLDLSNINTNNVTNMQYMFQNSLATTLDLSSFDTSNVTTMTSMFYNSQATTLDLSSFDTSNVTNMYEMFRSSQATTLDLSSFDTSNVTNMREMFYISQATTLDLTSFDTSNVTNMYYMFNGSQVTTLDLSSFDTSNVTNMSQMFRNSQATTGYARTQTDADNFNSSSNKPEALTFVVTNVALSMGLKKDLPVLNEHELAVTTDTKEIYVGSSLGNQLIVGELKLERIYPSPGDRLERNQKYLIVPLLPDSMGGYVGIKGYRHDSNGDLLAPSYQPYYQPYITGASPYVIGWSVVNNMSMFTGHSGGVEKTSSWMASNNAYNIYAPFYTYFNSYGDIPEDYIEWTSINQNNTKVYKIIENNEEE